MPSPIAHLAMGYAVYHCSQAHFARHNQRIFHTIPRLAIITAGLSMLPDLDAVPGILAGNLKQFHNNISHSFGFALLIALGIGMAIWLFRRTGFLRWFLLTLICYTLHIGMDFFTRGRGVMLFWPLSSQRFEPPLELFHGLRWSRGFPEAFEPLTLVTEFVFVAVVLFFVYASTRRRKWVQPRHMMMTLLPALLLLTAGLLFVLLRSSPVAATNGQTCPVTPAPVAYWQLDETDNNTRPPYLDYFASNNATACPDDNCPLPALNGQIKGAQRFNGRNTGITITDPADDLFDWGSSDTFSIAFWMQGVDQPNGTCISENEVMLGRDDPAAGSNKRWWIGCRRDTGGRAYFQLRDGISNGDTGDVRLGLEPGTTPVINDGSWHFLAGVYDGSSVYLYVDGTLAISQTADFDTNFSMDAPVTIGWLDLDSQFHYDGLLDEIALYDVALAADDVQRLYRDSRFGNAGYCSLAPALTLGIDPISTEPDNQYLYANETVTTTYIVQNLGVSPLTGVNVDNALCETITPTDSSLALNATQTFTCTFTSDTTITTPPATIESVARATSGAIQSLPVTNTFEIIQSGIALTSTVSPEIVAAGDPVTYTYTVTNTGNILLDNLVVQDECDTTTRVTPLAAADTWGFTCVFTPTSDIAGSSTVTATDPRGTTRSASASVPVDVVVNPQLAITRTSDPAQPDIGQNVTFTYTITNTGTDPLENVVLTDPQCSTSVDGPTEEDGNGDTVFDPAEVWTYTCATIYTLPTTTLPRVTAQDALGRSVSATTVVPGFEAIMYLPLVRN